MKQTKNTKNGARALRSAYAETRRRAEQGRTDYSLPPFQARFPWIGGDLQTVRNLVVSAVLKEKFKDPGGRRIWLDPGDGSGDRLAARLSWPADPHGATKPTAVLIHGLTGCEHSTYMQRTARHLLEQGHPVVRLNLRGAGPSRRTCRGIYHAGRTEDVAAALRGLSRAEPDLLEPEFFMVGFSLGGNTLLKFLAEYDGEFNVSAAASISAPIHLAATAQQFLKPRNFVYHAYMLERLKAECLGGDVSPAYVDAIRGARNIYELDDQFIAPAHGFRGADHYYDVSAAIRYLDGVRVPTLVIHAADDPWIPFGPYASYQWSRNDHLVPALLPEGGHVGFHTASGATWHDSSLGAFFQEHA
ncbi:MAG: alpha/beta fold hydrolase [Alphaproteobacteria bacterium]|nr:alpha/beta fold hydrolase [Alphaproteobacteria bacterium]